ncbi:MAG TPA: SUMF1/EgtB/PvdO family nonheme iron enzyme [Chitinispirillaceae bacterium]|nr:SUMF1/EgtB/PvdO family nonheme iron enzyme [Chitinispirillaceae bacterium]
MKFLIVLPVLISLSVAQYANCPQGSFSMGNDKGEVDEQPIHTVQLSQFKISVHEVTERQYDSCVQSGRCTPAHYDDGKCIQWTGSGFSPVKVPEQYRNPDYPVVCVSWHQALAYCRAKGLTLPTEAQWEYAASAGTGSTWSWGETPPDNKKCTMSGTMHPCAVGHFAANKWGLTDMTGNVWEWTSDYYSKDAYAVSSEIDPRGPDAGLYRVIRGGGWYSDKKALRTANRHWFTPESAEVSVGFRCAGN